MVSIMMPPPDSMLGYLVQHRLFGCGKIIAVGGNNIEVSLCDARRTQYFSKSAMQGGDFQRAVLHSGAIVFGPNGEARISGTASRDALDPTEYRITYADTGLSATVSEIELLPLPAMLSDNLPARLREGRTDPFLCFQARHNLLSALSRFNRQVGGLRALLASRIDLHPHQAFVAGTVILDPVRRYILADEVGLGKTIEAGIIIHDLLARRPDARVLILAPGPLTRQWLCELHSSFGGQGFRLADLHPVDDIDLTRWSKLICSTSLALDGLDEDLLDVPWDLVVVDEVHHLLGAPHLYDLVMQLSREAHDVLLLSAVPVRRRQGELYRLLALLEPEIYCQSGTSEEAFLSIYESQEMIGRRLNLLGHDLADFAAGEAEAADIVARIDRLLALPILGGDSQLQSMLAAAEGDVERAAEIGADVHLLVSDRYRVNRRILRNRRERLISQEQLTAISRSHASIPYAPDEIEVEAIQAVEALLEHLAQTTLLEDVRRPFARVLLQASGDPAALLDVLHAVDIADPANINAYGIEMLNGLVGLGGDRWPTLLTTLSAGVKASADPNLLETALRKARNWQASPSSAERTLALVKFLEAEQSAERKTLIFAGFPGMAERLSTQLQIVFGEKAVVQFRTDLPDMEKEESVRRFRSDPSAAFLVSDESGGEGRNFQFAHSLVHADLPWQPAIVEQRIGRLDRLGRETVSNEVISHVCASPGSLEAGLLMAYDEGLNVFGTSLSGLEFALRHMQDLIVDAATGGGFDAMVELIPMLSETAREERVRDGSEALLDEASYHAGRAERFLRTPAPGLETDLELAFTNYFAALAGPKSVTRYRAPDGSDGLWLFRPDQARHGELEIVDKDAAGELGKRVGTFSREIAQQKRDAEFFTFGNPLFDAVVRALSSQLTGRTYAVACKAPSVPSFVGVEIVIAARPKVSQAKISPSLLNLAEALFGTRRRPIFIPLHPDQTVDGTTLRDLRVSLSDTAANIRWRNLSGGEVDQIVTQYGGDLGECIDRAMGSVLTEQRDRFATELAEPLQSEIERVASQRDQLAATNSGAAAAEAEMLDNYIDLISGWDVVLDGIGFFAVNARG